MRLAYEQFGDQSAPALLMIAGMAQQRIAWPDALCEGLAAEGYRVIRYDNRDIGESTWTPGPPPRTLGKRYVQAMLGRRQNISVGPGKEAHYDLDVLASDAVGLLDALEIERAHVVGFSMGGMIAQLAAAEHPARVESLTSIMSSPNEPSLPKPKARVLMNLLKAPPATDPDPLAEASADMWALIGSPAYPPDETELRERLRMVYRRNYCPGGTARQLAAIASCGGRVSELKTIIAPALVIHGNDDPLVPVAAGIDTASHIPGAKLELIDGMGHDLPQPLWSRFIELISDHTRSAVAN